jgi:hypothetical protein
VQSLRLEAEVAEREALRDGPDAVLRVVHEFSRTARFANLDALGPRALSIAVNQDLAGASHRFQLKRHGKAKEVRILEATIKGCIDDYREVLTDAAEAKTKAGRHMVIRRLARLGRKLYIALAQEPVHEPIQPTLLELKPAMGETIQIVRLHSSFVFPWPILYDYPMPKRVYDGELETTPVCLGANGRQPCGHGPELKGCYCVNGFWGVRHRIEQLVDARETDQPELDKHGKPLGPLVQRPPRGGVRIAVGTVNKDTSTVAAELQRLLGDDGAVAEVRQQDALLDLLWEDQARPAVLVVLGHLKTSESPPEPSGPRIESGSLERYLVADDIGERWTEKGMARWTQPQTLVLLMACESGATELESLSDFVRALTAAGARAVIGTETKVRSDLLARFSKEMTAALWGGPGRPAEPLGTALNRFWREQLQTGDPRAFTFYAVGDADLTIAPVGNGA